MKLEVVRTLGDRLSIQEAPLDPKDPPQGIFTKELDEALLSGQIRAAIHSLKDVPTTLPAGISYGAFLELEVEMTDGESLAAGAQEARRLMRVFGIPEDALVAEAYVDLLERGGAG